MGAVTYKISHVRFHPKRQSDFLISPAHCRDVLSFLILPVRSPVRPKRIMTQLHQLSVNIGKHRINQFT